MTTPSDTPLTDAFVIEGGAYSYGALASHARALERQLTKARQELAEATEECKALSALLTALDEKLAAVEAEAREKALEEAQTVCYEIRVDGYSKPKPHEDNYGDGFIDACNECQWAIGALKDKPIALQREAIERIKNTDVDADHSGAMRYKDKP